jgi:hypothetical protein
LILNGLKSKKVLHYLDEVNIKLSYELKYAISNYINDAIQLLLQNSILKMKSKNLFSINSTVATTYKKKVNSFYTKIKIALNNSVRKSYLKINQNKNVFSNNFLESFDFKKVFGNSISKLYFKVPFHKPIPQFIFIISILESFNLDKKAALAYLRFQKSKDDLLKSLKVMPRSFFVIDYTSYPFNGCRRTRHYSR